NLVMPRFIRGIHGRRIHALRQVSVDGPHKAGHDVLVLPHPSPASPPAHISVIPEGMDASLPRAHTPAIRIQTGGGNPWRSSPYMSTRCRLTRRKSKWPCVKKTSTSTA